MKLISVLPAGKQPVKIASHINLCKKESRKDIIVRAIINRAKKTLTVQNITIAVGCIAATVSWFAAVVYDTTESQTALIVLSVSSIVGMLSLAPTFFDGKNEDAEL